MTIANVNVRQILLKRGNTIQSTSYTGPVGELTLDTDLDTVRVHDGVTAGGMNVLATQAQINTLTNTISTITGVDTGLLANAATQQTQINNITSGVTLFGNLIPSANVTYSLGNVTHQWKELYLSSNTIYLNSIPLSVNSNGDLLVNGNTVTNGTPSASSLINSSQTVALDSTGNLTLPTNTEFSASPAIQTTGIVFGDGTVQTTAATAGGDTDIYKFQYGIIGTKDQPDTGGWGGYNIVLDPGGESWAGLFIPSMATQDGGGSLNIYNNKSVNNNIALSVNTGSFVFGGDGTLTFPNYVKQSPVNTVQCLPNVDTVVYIGTGQWQHTFKLLLQAEGTEEGNPGTWDTQSAEMIIAKSFLGDKVAASLYGRVYTSANPLATFTAQWNATTSRVEVTCRPASTSNAVWVRTFATEITTSD